MSSKKPLINTESPSQWLANSTVNDHKVVLNTDKVPEWKIAMGNRSVPIPQTLVHQHTKPEPIQGNLAKNSIIPPAGLQSGSVEYSNMGQIGKHLYIILLNNKYLVLFLIYNQI